MPIISKGYDDIPFRLEHKAGGPVEIGDELWSSRNECCTLIGGRAPHKPSSSGFVDVTELAEGWQQQFYAHVFNLRWVPVTD